MARELQIAGAGWFLSSAFQVSNPLFPIDSICLHAESIYKDKEEILNKKNTKEKHLDEMSNYLQLSHELGWSCRPPCVLISDSGHWLLSPTSLGIPARGG